MRYMIKVWETKNNYRTVQFRPSLRGSVTGQQGQFGVCWIYALMHCILASQCITARGARPLDTLVNQGEGGFKLLISFSLLEPRCIIQKAACKTQTHAGNFTLIRRNFC